MHVHWDRPEVGEAGGLPSGDRKMAVPRHRPEVVEAGLPLGMGSIDIGQWPEARDHRGWWTTAGHEEHWHGHRHMHRHAPVVREATEPPSGMSRQVGKPR